MSGRAHRALGILEGLLPPPKVIDGHEVGELSPELSLAAVVITSDRRVLEDAIYTFDRPRRGTEAGLCQTMLDIELDAGELEGVGVEQLSGSGGRLHFGYDRAAGLTCLLFREPRLLWSILDLAANEVKGACVYPSRPPLTCRSVGRIHRRDFCYPAGDSACEGGRSIHLSQLSPFLTYPAAELQARQERPFSRAARVSLRQVRSCQ